MSEPVILSREDYNSLIEQLETTRAELIAKDKEIENLSQRLKSCLNHDSLIATRSELSKKDKEIELMREVVDASKAVIHNNTGSGWSNSYLDDALEKLQESLENLTKATS